MKTKLYLYGCILTTLSIFCFQIGFSQCNCGGTPATAVEYTTSFGSSATYPAIEFPKFDPSIGTLSCMTFSAIMQGTTTSTATATAGSDKFSFLLALTPRLEAPGFDLSNTILKTYGPDSLGSQHWIDSVNLVRPQPTTVVNSKTYGPEPIMVNANFTSSINGPPAYYTTNLATPVAFTFSISGGLTTTAGGSNYIASVATVASGTFKLTYYWCPNSVLATNIRNFLTTLYDNTVKVEWTSQNKATGTMYELQVSSDGKNFKTIYIQPSQLADGSAGSYQYLYNASHAGTDELYFRIKQTDATGRVIYTSVNTVSLSRTRSNYMGVYPNPATDKISLQFEKELDGDFTIDIVNLTGQRVFNKDIHITRSKFAQIDLNNPPSRGMYYVRATDQRTGAIFVNKLFMK